MSDAREYVELPDPLAQQIFRQVFEILAFERKVNETDTDALTLVAQELYHLSQQYDVDSDKLLDELEFLGVER